ncbi:MAG: 2TM domain-containing protein [Gemmataceae bacterium]
MHHRDEATPAAQTTKAARGFYIHLANYLIVNALLVVINLLTSPDRLWFYWPVLGWGIGIAFHAAAVFVLPRLTGRRP